MSAADTLTVLRSVSGKHAAKTFTRKRDGKITNRGYGAEMFFSVEAIPVSDITTLADALERLAAEKYAFVIRGEAVSGIDRAHTLRRALPDEKNGLPATFIEKPRHWLLVDVDHLPMPAATDPKADPEDAVEYVLGKLPPELHDASCWWQWSSSQSVFPDADSLSLHLWFWSLDPLGDAELSRWAVAANSRAGFKLIDPALYRAVQAHYVAKPSFEGLDDPLPRRSGRRDGLESTVTLLIPPANVKNPELPGNQGYEPGLGVAAHLAQIGGPQGFRRPIMSAIASYVATYGSAADSAPLKEAIRAALDRAEPDWRNAPGGDKYAGDEHLDKIIDWMRNHHGDQPPKGFVGEPPPGFDDAPPPEADALAGERLAEFSDDVLALEFTAQYADELRYVALRGKWMLWSGTHWHAEETLRAFDLARLVCRRISAEVPPNMAERATAIASAKTIAAVERLAKADRRHACEIADWDPDFWLLNKANTGAAPGTIDLRTGVTHSYRREDMITKIIACDADGDCPKWRSFLDRVTAGDRELQLYLQRVAGYCLTGSTREHVMFFLHGTGANGKGVFLNTLRAVWNDYAAVAPMETFIETYNDRHPTDLAMLRGVRLVIAQETERGRRWAEGKIKALTGGEPITARFMRQDFFTYDPQFKILIAGNHKPSLRGVDEAIRRRLHLVPFTFTVTIPPAERNLNLTNELKAEWPGILLWAIDGCALWQEKGLAPPERVCNASAEYFAEEDVLGTWIDQCCAVDPIYSELCAELFQRWKIWAENAGERPGSLKVFSQNLDKRGFKRCRQSGTGKAMFSGIALK
jgi:putative DNA primase/helicase